MSNPSFRIRWSLILIIFILAILNYAEIDLCCRYYQEYISLVLQYRDDISIHCYQEAPDLVYHGIPNACGHNSQGYVDRDHAFEKDPGVYRIVIIGDSIIVAERAKDPPAVFSRAIEQLLNGADPHRRYEVVKLAVTGYNTTQEIRILKDVALRYNPDLILWSYCLNDPDHPVLHGGRSNGDRGIYFYTPRFFLWTYLAQKSYYLDEEVRRTVFKCDPKEYHTYLHCLYWDKVAANFAVIARITRAKNIPVFFVIHPIFTKVRAFSNYPVELRKLHHKLADLAKQNGFVAIDLLTAYKPYSTRQLCRYRKRNVMDVWHPNDRGYEVAERYIVSRLLKFLHLTTEDSSF